MASNDNNTMAAANNPGANKRDGPPGGFLVNESGTAFKPPLYPQPPSASLNASVANTNQASTTGNMFRAPRLSYPSMAGINVGVANANQASARGNMLKAPRLSYPSMAGIDVSVANTKRTSARGNVLNAPNPSYPPFFSLRSDTPGIIISDGSRLKDVDFTRPKQSLSERLATLNQASIYRNIPMPTPPPRRLSPVLTGIGGAFDDRSMMALRNPFVLPRTVAPPSPGSDREAARKAPMVSLRVLMANQGHGTTTAVAPQAVNNDLNTGGNGTIANIGEAQPAASDIGETFTLFQSFPTELRFMIWEASMEMEEPRLIHLHARGCGLRGHRRAGCPRGYGSRIKIYGDKYEQAPKYLFVNHECRYLALQHYNIRFSVIQRCLVGGVFDRRETNIIMCPDDILVSWHWNRLQWNTQNFTLQFGPEASRVRNLMVNPWRTEYSNYNQATLDVLCKLIDKLGNMNAIKSVFVLRSRGLGSLEYEDSNQFTLDPVWLEDAINKMTPALRARFGAFLRGNRLEWHGVCGKL